MVVYLRDVQKLPHELNTRVVVSRPCQNSPPCQQAAVVGLSTYSDQTHVPPLELTAKEEQSG